MLSSHNLLMLDIKFFTTHHTVMITDISATIRMDDLKKKVLRTSKSSDDLQNHRESICLSQTPDSSIFLLREKKENVITFGLGAMVHASRSS